MMNHFFYMMSILALATALGSEVKRGESIIGCFARGLLEINTGNCTPRRTEMADAERIARLESVLAALISWLHRELGTAGAGQLLDRLARASATEADQND